VAVPESPVFYGAKRARGSIKKGIKRVGDIDKKGRAWYLVIQGDFYERY
jgi:hypothetical protein